MLYNQLFQHCLELAVSKNSEKLVGKPTSLPTIDFKLKALELPKFEKSNITTINP